VRLVVGRLVGCLGTQRGGGLCLLRLFAMLCMLRLLCLFGLLSLLRLQPALRPQSLLRLPQPLLQRHAVCLQRQAGLEGLCRRLGPPQQQQCRCAAAVRL
jgi:hypothetical protein